MKRSQDRILTTHVGSLSRPPDLIALNQARARGGSTDEAAYAATLAAAVSGVVRKQRDVGIDIVNDGEFGKPMGQAYDYGVWWNYAFERMDGFALPDSIPESAHKPSSVANLALTSFANRRDWQKFNEFYQDPESTGLTGSASAGGRCARARSATRVTPRSGPTSTTSRPRSRPPAPSKDS